ncbi:MAG: HD domain-containing protein [Candidatus Cloacimonetes bacterium]|nr:HD domain-containing protein [Candidatus Cloacimonadota bacterium]
MVIAQNKVHNLKKWFLQYTESYTKCIDNHNINLKLEHTFKVCDDIITIGRILNLKPVELRLAEIMGLFHDVARFEQYKNYGTFNDSASINHAELGVEILKKENVLHDLDNEAQQIILKAILYHNRLHLPADEAEEILFYSKLLRDADKLDIFRIVTEYYALPQKQRNKTLELELPETPEFSEDILQQVTDGKDVDYHTLKSFNDFKLLQAGWVFTLNFTPTRTLLKNRHYLEIIRKNLPADPRITALFTKINNHLTQY